MTQIQGVIPPFPDEPKKAEHMQLAKLNKFLNFFLLVFVVDVSVIIDPDGNMHVGSDTRVGITTIFRGGYVYEWPHIKLLLKLGV